MTAALPAHLLIHTVARIRPSTSTDGHGNAVRDYTVPPATSTSMVGRVEQNRAGEPREDGRDAAVRDWTFFTNEADITQYDRIVFGSLTFEVEGPPAPAYGSGAFHHSEVGLRLVSG